jgi:hypothetical protein
MSKNIAQFLSEELGSGYARMGVNAYLGSNLQRSVQFTIDDRYCALCEQDVIELIAVLKLRLDGAHGYCATDTK